MKIIKILVLLGFLGAALASCGGQVSPYEDKASNNVELSDSAIR
jgi:hypothetical protein